MSDLVELQQKIFEENVRSVGPEVAYRQFSQMFGEELGLRLLHAHEKKVGLITNMQGSPTLQGERRFADWYSGPGEDDRFWPVLKKHLLEKKGWPVATVESLDVESTNVVKRLAPVFGPVDVKGLVVGYVQSGKTANYSAVIAKAADVGYRLIIVLAGIHNSLRRQTQTRLQSEICDANEQVKADWHTLTQPHEDFRAGGTKTDAFLNQHSHQRILLVIKKNAHVLKRLIKWLKAAQPRLLEACPALIIDDEADQAGLNTGDVEKDERTAINSLILELKETLPKSAYIGYTATPFANVLVDASGDDLYPSDFIVALRKPPAYFGAELFFGREPLPDEGAEPPAPPDIFRKVDDKEVPLLRPANRAELEGFSPGMTDSLRTAIEYFLLATAARWVRGHRMRHSSMLVHTAMNVSVHRSFKECIDGEVKRFRKRLDEPKMREHLEELWNDEHARVRRPELGPVSFASLAERLPMVLERLEVVVDNSKSDSRLVYKEEETLQEGDQVVHIAVGGNTLSRGLTLEGLMVSYFVRSASTYDTLLQMGRWFGYRFGYEDLPRLWMTDELRLAFRDLATVEEEIRNDIARYDEDKVTPREFAVRIRTHPTMAVTSRLKMQYAVPVKIDYAGFTRQTTRFRHEDKSWLQKNWAAGEALVGRIKSSGCEFVEKGPHHFARKVPLAEVLAFLDAYECHPQHTEMRRDFLRKYLETQASRGACTLWTVAIVTLTKETLTTSLGHIKIAPVNRSVLEVNGDSVDLGTITTQKNFGFDLDTDVATATGRQPKRPLGTDPLLLLVPINKNSSSQREGRSKLNAADDILGIALAFPDAGKNRVGENYIQVQLPLQQQYVEHEEFAMAEDDG